MTAFLRVGWRTFPTETPTPLPCRIWNCQDILGIWRTFPTATPSPLPCRIWSGEVPQHFPRMFSASEARFGWGGEVGKWGGLPYTRYTQDVGKFPTPNFPKIPHQGGHLMFGVRCRCRCFFFSLLSQSQNKQPGGPPRLHKFDILPGAIG